MTSKPGSAKAGVQHTHVDFSSMEKSEVSKTLYGQIQWEQLPSSGVFLQHKDHQLLERAQANLAVVLDNQPDAKEYVAILLKIAENCTTNVVVQQYVFTRMEEILGLGVGPGGADEGVYGMKHAPLFLSSPTNKLPEACFKALQFSDIYVQKACANVYAALLSVYAEVTEKTSTGGLTTLLTYLTNKISSPAQGVWDMAIPPLTLLVRTPLCRPALRRGGVVEGVSGALKRVGVNAPPQQLYDLLFILWALSLGVAAEAAESGELVFSHGGVVSGVVEVLAASPSRKVTRLCIMTLKNLAETKSEHIFNELFTSPLPRILDTLGGSTNSSNNSASASASSTGNIKMLQDEEGEQDFHTLHDLLTKHWRELSSFDRWANEVEGGALRWGVVHTEKFWRENAKFVEKNNFQLLKTLVGLLKSSDEAVVSVALYDLGEFARFYPNGRVVVSRLGGKEVVLSLLEQAEGKEEVYRQALQCVSKLMVSHWEHVK